MPNKRVSKSMCTINKNFVDVAVAITSTTKLALQAKQAIKEGGGDVGREWGTRNSRIKCCWYSAERGKGE